ncbi:hypothetical protein HNQ02_002807 [Flavobacterium sp. 7E]|uniref:hypothetical protein n=1 Tax=unclassified Flavobacterium TaxID=196869 RepID=UPI00156DA2A0|nr:MULTISPECIES: hypothetical protein [unclassified Flavobacterium]MBE0392398.1 hypothetical protein [Flavobacterium sp. PL002]NRS89873.1 hypothetical protein [Flavobacterium sp. 7E]
MSKIFYNVQHSVALTLNNKADTTAVSYTISIEKNQEFDHLYKLNRDDFKINDKIIDTKFNEVANAYFALLFPIIFFHDGKNCAIRNHKQILEKIYEGDKYLCDQYDGEGIKYIREQFLEQVNTEEKMEHFIFSLPLFQLLQLAMQTKEDDSSFSHKWQIMPVGEALWEGVKKHIPINSLVEWELELVDKLAFKSDLTRYLQDNNIEKTVDPTAIVSSKISSSMNYNDTYDNIEAINSELTVSCEPYFTYKEHFYLTQF